MVIVIIVLMIGLFAILIFAKKKDKKAKKAKRKAAQTKDEEAALPAPSGPATDDTALLEPTPAYQPGPAVQEYQGPGDGQPPAAIEAYGQAPSLEPARDDILALPPARSPPVGVSKEVVLDEIFGGMEQTNAQAVATGPQPAPVEPAQRPVMNGPASPAGAKVVGKGAPTEAEIDDIFASIDNPAKK